MLGLNAAWRTGKHWFPVSYILGYNRIGALHWYGRREPWPSKFLFNLPQKGLVTLAGYLNASPPPTVR